jgi:hypothetical protein
MSTAYAVAAQALQISIEAFVDKMAGDLAHFREWYYAVRDIEPDDYPLTQKPYEWADLYAEFGGVVRQEDA